DATLRRRFRVRGRAVSYSVYRARIRVRDLGAARGRDFGQPRTPAAHDRHHRTRGQRGREPVSHTASGRERRRHRDGHGRGDQPGRARRRTVVARVTRVRVTLFLLLFASYAYFYQAGGWNQNSRFNLVRAIVNDHSLLVDPYHRSTGDQAFFDGHYYSDKAP